jgi:hypothetical protein
MIPLPFSRCAVYTAPGLFVTDTDEQTRLTLKENLEKANRVAERCIGISAGEEPRREIT